MNHADCEVKLNEAVWHWRLDCGSLTSKSNWWGSSPGQDHFGGLMPASLLRSVIIASFGTQRIHAMSRSDKHEDLDMGRMKKGYLHVQLIQHLREVTRVVRGRMLRALDGGRLGRISFSHRRRAPGRCRASSLLLPGIATSFRHSIRDKAKVCCCASLNFDASSMCMWCYIQMLGRWMFWRELIRLQSASSDCSRGSR